MLDLVAHLAFLLIAVSYLVRDILWLRVLSVVASVFGIAYYWLAPAHPLWIVIGWNLAFAAINVVHLVLLVRERSGIRLSDLERELHETLFRSLAPFEFLKLLRIARWRKVAAGEVLVRQGAPAPGLILLYHGAAAVTKDGEALALLRDGDLIGEMSFTTGEAAAGTVTTELPSRLLCWSDAALHALLERNPNMRTALQGLFSADMAHKLVRSPGSAETIDLSAMRDTGSPFDGPPGSEP